MPQKHNQAQKKNTEPPLLTTLTGHGCLNKAHSYFQKQLDGAQQNGSEVEVEDFKSFKSGRV